MKAIDKVEAKLKTLEQRVAELEHEVKSPRYQVWVYSWYPPLYTYLPYTTCGTDAMMTPNGEAQSRRCR